MRLRHIKGSREAIELNPYVIKNEKDCKGQWAKVFGNSHPIYIEIGMGKGKFLHEMARQNPDINYIGIEKFSSVLLRALEKRESYDGKNLLFIRMDAEDITEVFAKGEVERIYLNFSDPWPKERHAKRRLTSVDFWARYDQFLTEENGTAKIGTAKIGSVIFKTDNRRLFDFSLEQVTAAGWILANYTFDLHHSQYSEGNIMTEYEEKFTGLGHPICRLAAYRRHTGRK